MTKTNKTVAAAAGAAAATKHTEMLPEQVERQLDPFSEISPDNVGEWSREASDSFEFFSFNDKKKPIIGREFIGHYLGNSDEHRDLFPYVPEMIGEFIAFSDTDGIVNLLPTYYELSKYFKRRERNTQTLYKIVLKKVKQLDKGSLYIFDIYRKG